MTLPDLSADSTAKAQDPKAGDGAAKTTEAQLKEYTPAEMYDKNQKLLDESVPDVPLISELAPLATLRAEYEKGSASYVSQIDWLIDQGYTGLRRSRGDGDCFYRSLAFAYIEQLLHSPRQDRDAKVAASLSILQATRDLVLACGTDEFIVEEPYDTFTSLIRNVTTTDGTGRTLTDERLVARFQDQDEDAVAAYIVYYLRMITSAHLKAKHVEHDYFFYDPDRDLMLAPEDFCQRFVDPVGVEADHMQILALCRELKVNLHIAYLDGRKSDSVDFHKMEEGGDRAPLVLLYRPGHYDILVKS